MTSFITSSIDHHGFRTITIDGSAKEAKKSQFHDGEEAVQLRRARVEESKFNWSDPKIRKVVAKNVLIYDDIDLRCLHWFIDVKIQIDLSESYVSPDAFEKVSKLCEHLKSRNKKVQEGSSIRVPLINGYSGMGRLDRVTSACRSIGFKCISPL